MKNEIILADTTVWIHFFRGAGTLVQDRLAPLIMADRLVTANVIIMEILHGARSQKDYDKLRQDLSAMHCLEVSANVWERACQLAFTLRKNGANVPLTDTLIASLAQEYDALLLHDDRHYELIASVVPLKHEYLKPQQA